MADARHRRLGRRAEPPREDAERQQMLEYREGDEVLVEGTVLVVDP